MLGIVNWPLPVDKGSVNKLRNKHVVEGLVSIAVNIKLYV
jgi:hypothetical protein